MNANAMPPLPRALIVCGPTGIGKTRAAIELALRFDGEIVGADSMQIYRRMDIGTAKPTPEEKARVRHHMVDIADPDTPYDAARYASDAWQTIRQLEQRGRLPVVAGGTGFYIKALIYGLFDSPSPDPDLRRKLEHLADRLGNAGLHARLAAVDPAAAASIHLNDRFRIVRALETLEAGGRPISALRREHGFAAPRLRAFKLGLTMPREALYARIDRRVERMIAEGLLEEVRGLLEQGYAAELKSMQSIGYRHMAAFLRREVDWPETVRLLKRDTRRYAKRQMTWFRADPDIVWTHPDALTDVIPAIAAFLEAGPPAAAIEGGDHETL